MAAGASPVPEVPSLGQKLIMMMVAQLGLCSLQDPVCPGQAHPGAGLGVLVGKAELGGGTCPPGVAEWVPAAWGLRWLLRSEVNKMCLLHCTDCSVLPPHQAPSELIFPRTTKSTETTAAQILYPAVTEPIKERVAIFYYFFC